MNGKSIPQGWQSVLEPVLASPEFAELENWLRAEEAAGKTIYPPPAQRLRALELIPPQDVKAVILGQDPYHGPGQAHGLSFSVPYGMKLPPSLRNIYRELADDLSTEAPLTGNLEHWARQGVLLLNTSLTVEAGLAGSHSGRGWEALTDAIIAAVAGQTSPAVFILWGGHAHKTAQRIAALRDTDRHLILKSPHPSPLSAYRGFFGSKPFSRANAFLEKHGRGAVDWAAPR